jgi:uracil phosphoribosyltransferase
MIGTGNAMITALEAALKGPAKDLPLSQVHVVGIFVTPEAAARVRNRFPEISIYGASFDNRLNERGWIIPNNPEHFLGDFGDCFAPAGLSNEHIGTLVGKKALIGADVEALFKRMQQA